MKGYACDVFGCFCAAGAAEVEKMQMPASSTCEGLGEGETYARGAA